MTWSWALSQAVDDADLAADLRVGWPSQPEAESWMKDMFSELLDGGIHEATLMDGAEAVYTMSLDE